MTFINFYDQFRKKIYRIELFVRFSLSSNLRVFTSFLRRRNFYWIYILFLFHVFGYRVFFHSKEAIESGRRKADLRSLNFLANRGILPIKKYGQLLRRLPRWVRQTLWSKIFQSSWNIWINFDYYSSSELFFSFVFLSHTFFTY